MTDNKPIKTNKDARDFAKECFEKAHGDMTDTEIKEKILYILTWLTGEKTILTNSLQAKELNEYQYAVMMNNAIARAVTEIKELL
jgi:phosphoribosyl-dephospho-CoA transferase